MRTLLERWRAAERQLDDAPTGTPEWLRARVEFESARAAYLEEMDAPLG